MSLGSLLTLLLLVAILATLAKPGAAAAVLFLFFALEQLVQFHFRFFFFHPTVLNFAFLGVVGTSAAWTVFLRNRQRPRMDPTLLILLAAFLLYVVVAQLWSIDPLTSQRVLLERLPYLLCFALLGALAATSVRAMENMLTSIVLLGTILFPLLLFTTYWGKRGILLENGTQLNPLAPASAAGYFLLAVLCVPKIPIKDALVVRIGLSCVALAVALRTGSRGQVLAMLAVAGLLFALETRNVRARVVFLTSALALFLLFLFGATILTTDASRWSSTSVSEAIDRTRLEPIRALLNSWTNADLPTIFFGFGPGATNSPLVWQIEKYPHNILVEALTELGIAGFSLFLGLCIYVFVLLRRIRFFNPSHSALASARFVFGVLLFDFAVGLKSGSLYSQGTFFLVLLLVGILYETAKLPSPLCTVYGRSLPATDSIASRKPATILSSE